MRGRSVFYAGNLTLFDEGPKLCVKWDMDWAEDISMKNYRFSVIIERDKDGYYAYAPDLKGCYSQGDSYEEVVENIKDAIRLHVEYLVESGEVIDVSDNVSLTSLEVAV
jgi:predicted RNase H-like HicB family nuclease